MSPFWSQPARSNQETEFFPGTMQSQAVANSYLALSFFCAAINLVPTASHIIQGHSGLACFGIWVVILNSLNFINGVVWRHDSIDRAPVFCDISIRITFVGPLALMISNWCIIRYLASIVAPDRAMDSAAESRKRIVLDCALSFGFPLAVAAGSVVYQTARYQVLRLSGCVPVYVLSWPTTVMVLIWPVIFCGANCACSVYVIYRLVRQRRNVRHVMENSNVHLSRFIRMCALAATYLCIAAPHTILGLILNIHAIGPYVPWKSWSSLHDEENSLSSVRQNPIYNISWHDWFFIIAGITVFFLFSFANESVAIYKRCAKAIHVKCHGRKAVHPVNSVGIRSVTIPYDSFGIPTPAPQNRNPQELNYRNGSDTCNSLSQIGESRRLSLLDIQPAKPYSPCIHVSITKEQEVLYTK